MVFIKIGCEFADVVVKANDVLRPDIESIVEENANKKIEAMVEDENITDTFYNIYTELVDFSKVEE